MALGGSLWLVPDPESDCFKQLSQQINSLATSNEWGVNVAPQFNPHMTITSSITDHFLSPAKTKVTFPGYSYLHLDELKLPYPEVKAKEIVFGEEYYKRIFIRLERTESLLSLVKLLRSQFVGESEDDLNTFMDSFDPHVSLAYAESFTQTPNHDLDHLLNLDFSAFKFIVLMDCRAQVSGWKACPIRVAL